MLKQLFVGGLLILTLVSLGGCGGGEGDETNAPTTKLTSTLPVASSSVNGHSHTLSIPFADLGTSSTVSYRSSTSAGHTHSIALSALQVSDLNLGRRVLVTSGTAGGHAHTWEIRGGVVLYDALCYNCHTDDRRGTRGMSSSPLTSVQRDALQNPANAPLSTVPSVAPDSGIVPPLPSADGASLYSSNCAVCHGPLVSSSKRGSSANAIANAIVANRGGMGSLSTLTTAQIEAIAASLR